MLTPQAWNKRTEFVCMQALYQVGLDRDPGTEGSRRWQWSF